jgi:methyltransferase (TIGR00027 family)
MPIENISATARWMAYARAVEAERADALFQDPFSRRLAGATGEAIAREIGDAEFIARSIAVRTAVMDELILQTVNGHKADLILNLAAGLDTRPWRLALPATLRWVDVDFPAVLEYKASVIGSEPTACEYECLQADITETTARARVLTHCAGARRVLVITEGLLVYLTSAQVSALAQDLHGPSSFMWWLTDLTGPRALEMLRTVWGPKLRGAQFQFGPADSSDFFQRLGWRELLFRSSQEEARRLKRGTRVTLLSRLMLLLSSAAFREEIRRLSGVTLLARDTAPQSDVVIRARSTPQS